VVAGAHELPPEVGLLSEALQGGAGRSGSEDFGCFEVAQRAEEHVRG